MHHDAAEDCHHVDAFNDTDDPTTLGLCVPQLLEDVTEKHGTMTSLICAEKTLTFQDLNASANRLARVLMRRGVSRGHLVGVALHRSTDLVAVLLAVWKMGAAYVPIDPALPAERINQMMEDACPKLVVSCQETTEAFVGVACLSIDDLLLESMQSMSDSKSSSINPDGVAVRSEDLAYVMYTSGSTGRPKGVEVTHGGVANLLLSLQKNPGCNNADRLLGITTVSFDMAVVELFLPLLCGATTVIAQSHEIKDTAALMALMKRHNINIMQGTPAIWQMLLDSGWTGQPRLQKIFCGGEALSRSLADRLLACGDELWNMYGPTEATVYGSIWRVQPDQDIIIGGPIANARLYVLDENQSPVPLGSLGELYIGGAGVARSYRNRSELSRAHFVENPFHGGFMYRTGDLARMITSDKLSVMGRMDGQVKIRGHRIEIGDIEAAITELESISGAVVTCRDDRLVAYCVRVPMGKSSSTFNSASQEVEMRLDSLLRPWLSKRLPGYMVPAFFVELSSFPVTINGKIDRRALPDPLAAIQTPAADMKPTTELEHDILRIWSGVLGHDRIGINDSFFEVGGDSVRLIRLQKELEKLLGRLVASPVLFEHYTIKRLALHLSSSPSSSNDERPTEEVLKTKDIHTRGSEEDIAIVSMACRLPGGVTTPDEFWALLESGGDAITDVPEGRWDDNPHAYKTYRGGFIPCIDSYDISFFGISPREARSLDPSHYMMLETCWEGFERAGYTAKHLRGSQTGVFIGSNNILAHQSLNRNAIRDLDQVDGYTTTGSAGGTISGRISYHLGLEGPTMTIDTACSSSLVATHLACTALRQGECDMAISGGVTLMLNAGLHVEFSRLGGMSSDGRCRAFSADADGTGWSEGCVAVVMKRLSDAQRDGDRVHGVIRGSAVNHDGRSASLTTPSGSAQSRLVRRALAAARLQPGDVDYVEAHGTATKLGDPIEATALGEVFGASRCPHFNRTKQRSLPLLIGSAKSNIGHTQAAAGLVGLLKVILAMQRNTLPPSLHISEPTPAVDWQRSNMMPVLSTKSWLPQAGRIRRAGVSAFGIGGTNAHIIIEEAPNSTSEADICRNDRLLCVMPLPFCISGSTNGALRVQAEKLHQHLSSCPLESQHWFRGVAYSLATTRNHFQRRSVLIAHDKAELLGKLESMTMRSPDSSIFNSAPPETFTPRVCMLFTGQGSQWLGMGRGLCQTYPIFRAAIEDVAAHFTDLNVPLLDAMWGHDAELLNRTDFAQCALFSLELALWRLWQSWGVRPDFVLGHSLGEIVVAHVTGVFNLADACRLVAARGRLMQAQSGDTIMVSLGASAPEVMTTIRQLAAVNEVDIALYNTPMQTVVSGNTTAVEKIKRQFEMEGHKTKTLVVGHAFHSRHMDGMLEKFRAVVETIRFNPPTLNIISSVTGKLATAGQLEQADYWVRQVREPVRFSDSIQALNRHRVKVFLELGPQPTLCGMGAECLADVDDADDACWLPSLMPRKDSVVVLQQSVAALHVRHVSIDWAAYFEPLGCRRVELPTYAFQRQFIAPGRDSQPSDRTASSGVSVSTSCAQKDELQGLGHHQFRIEWHPVPTEEMVHVSGTWGLLIPSNNKTARSWGYSVKHAVEHESGIRLVEVDNLKQAEELDVDGVMCLWDSDEADVVSQSQDLVAKALDQLQTAARTLFTSPLIWVTRHAVGTGDDRDADMKLGAGALWGLMRTARNEHPELHLRLVDVDSDTGIATTLALILYDDEPECAVRQDRLLVPRMQKVDVHTDVESVHVLNSLQGGKRQLIRPDGAVLITGGLGQLGRHVARWLASEHGIRHLVLTSRHGIEAPGAKTFVEELTNMFGVKITVIAGDASNPDSVKSIMELLGEEQNLPWRGIVHAAGVSDSGILMSMTPERCATTLKPKAYSAWLLHEATRQMPELDMFVMFSSISGVMGMPGLANYAAANSFLDALAYHRRAQGLPATSVAYGTWGGDGGMAARLAGNTLSNLARFGLDSLTPDEALRLFKEAVVSKRALTVAAALDLKRLRSSVVEEQGGIPPLLCLLFDSESVADTETENPVASGWDIWTKLKGSETRQHSIIVLGMVRDVVAKALCFAHSNHVDVDRPLQDIGIDSLTAVQMRNHLATLTGLRLSVNIAFLHPNLRALSQFLLSQLQDTDTASSSSSASNSSDTSATTSCESPAPGLCLDVAAICRGLLDRSFTFDNVAQNPTPRGTATIPLESVFLTGATGFVGAFILYDLLEQGIPTHCLVRATNPQEALQKVITTLQDYDLWTPTFSPLIHPIVGDLSQPLLGLPNQIFNDLSTTVDAICHAGALVDWMRPLSDYIGPNIISTHELLRLASQGRAKTLHLVSTMSTLPMHTGHGLDKGDQEYGYGTSKYTAERLVAAARWRGARTVVYRLPYVTASALSGHFRRDRGDFLHNLLRGCLEMGACFPALGDADMAAVVPVDYVGRTVAAVMTRDFERVGKEYDFLSAGAPSCLEFFRTLGALNGGEDGGGGQEVLAFRVWKERALEYAVAHPRSSLARIAAVLDGYTDETAPSMFKGLAVGEHVLGGEHYPAPSLDEGFIQGYLGRIHAEMTKDV